MTNAQTVTVPVSLLQGFVTFVEKSGKLIERAGQEQAQAKEAAPAVVDTLVKQGLLDESQKEAATDALGSSHAKALESLRRTATHVRPYSLGEGVEKAAGADDVSDKDRRFLAAIGFDQPM